MIERQNQRAIPNLLRPATATREIPAVDVTIYVASAWLGGCESCTKGVLVGSSAVTKQFCNCVCSYCFAVVLRGPATRLAAHAFVLPVETVTDPIGLVYTIHE